MWLQKFKFLYILSKLLFKLLIVGSGLMLSFMISAYSVFCFDAPNPLPEMYRTFYIVNIISAGITGLCLYFAFTF